MDLEATLRELYGLERFGIKLGLETVRDLLTRLGDPHLGFPAVHVTGTNGKGSVCAFLDAIYREAGYRVGLYTSPHLVRFNERIRVDGRTIEDGDVARLYTEVKAHADAMAAEGEAKRPTFFEVTTAMAFLRFAERGVDVAVVEVGMGGGMDATNVVRPEACVITRIGLEHTEHLGRTVERIAREKAGILKPGAAAVTVDQPALPVLRAAAERVGSRLTVVGGDVRVARVPRGLDGQDVTFEDGAPFPARIRLLGTFQPENAALAYAAVRAADRRFPVDDGALRRGLEGATWAGRLQVVRRDPLVLVDGAHNAPAAEALAASLSELVPAKGLRLVVGILNDKDLARMAAALGPFSARVLATRPDSKRAFSPEEVAGAFSPYAPTTAVPSVREALARAIDEGPGVVVVTGSIYTAGEALAALGAAP